MRFEDLKVWEKSLNLCIEIYKMLKNSTDFTFKNQITKSALSISSNIAEGFERDSDKECIRFLIIAKGSCGELRSQIYVGMRIGCINNNTANNWIHQAIEISNMLAGLIKTKRNFLKMKQ